LNEALQAEATGNRTTVLMYHAIEDTTVPAVDSPAADPHYSVSPLTFSDHLRAIADVGARGVSVLDRLAGTVSGASVAVTFDDGHASNRQAADVLAGSSMTADFFVNPFTIGSAGFLTWAELREMLQLGMSIQSHGMHHRYLSDMSPVDVKQELLESRIEIEQQVGAAVTIFAPPGGRMPPQFALTAAQAGYRAVCSSAVGYWQPARRRAVNDPALTDAEMIPRLAVLNATEVARFRRWISGHRPEMWKLQMRSALLQGAKRAVGNQRYDKLRQAIVGGPA